MSEPIWTHTQGTPHETTPTEQKDRAFAALSEFCTAVEELVVQPATAEDIKIQLYNLKRKVYTELSNLGQAVAAAYQSNLQLEDSCNKLRRENDKLRQAELELRDAARRRTLILELRHEDRLQQSQDEKTAADAAHRLELRQIGRNFTSLYNLQEASFADTITRLEQVCIETKVEISHLKEEKAQLAEAAQLDRNMVETMARRLGEDDVKTRRKRIFGEMVTTTDTALEAAYVMRGSAYANHQSQIWDTAANLDEVEDQD